MTFEEYLSTSAIEMDLTDFHSVASVRNVPERHFQGALAFLYCFGLRGRWHIEQNSGAGTYNVMFENEDDAFEFKLFL
jgi:hypothetical protein